MRKFYIKNSIGVEFPLNGERGVWLTNPFGFGYQKSPTFGDLGRGFFVVTNDLYEPQGQCGGDVVFVGDDPYKDYTDFVNFLNGGYALEVGYQPKDTRYWCAVEIDTVEKTEIGDMGWLTVPVTFNKTTPWYLPSPLSLRLEPASEGGVKRYNYRYPYRYQQGRFASSLEVKAQGHMNSSVVITINGPLTNPIIMLKDTATGAEYGSIKLATTVYGGSTLVYSSKPNDAKVTIDGQDAVQYIDVANNNFFQIPLNTTCELSINADTGVTTTAFIQIYDYFRSV